MGDMGEIQTYNVSRNDISDRVCVGSVNNLGTGSITIASDYSSGLNNAVAVGWQGTASPYRNSNLNYGGIYLDEDWANKLCKEIKAINESSDCDEITVPPMRGFIEI
jgi:hypothetical protein